MPSTATGVRIRRATPQDAGACGPICYDAFAAINKHHNYPPEFPSPEVATGVLSMLFSHPRFYGVVAETDEGIVGSNCLDERSIVAGLGPVTVAPSAQNQGVGRALMEAMLDRARERGSAGVRLVQATFHNRSLSLYTKVGFEVREPLAVMQGLPGNAEVPGCRTRTATEEDVEAANRLCEAAHGHIRDTELRDAIGQGSAIVVERDGAISGYAAGFGYFGHAIAESNRDLKALIASAENVLGPGILVPTRNTDLLRWCLGQGMRVLQPMTLMTIGLYNEPSSPYLPSVLY